MAIHVGSEALVLLQVPEQRVNEIFRQIVKGQGSVTAVLGCMPDTARCNAHARSTFQV